MVKYTLFVDGRTYTDTEEQIAAAVELRREQRLAYRMYLLNAVASALDALLPGEPALLD